MEMNGFSVPCPRHAGPLKLTPPGAFRQCDFFFNFNSKTDKLVCHSAHEINILKNVQEHLITNFSLVFFKEPSLLYNLAFIFVLKKNLAFVNDPTGRHATVITP